MNAPVLMMGGDWESRKEPDALIEGAYRERVHLVRERVKCGKPSCHCARGLRHGPYTFLRYEYWDGAAGRDRYAREYVPRSELPGCGCGSAARELRRRSGGVKRGVLRRILVAIERRKAKGS